MFYIMRTLQILVVAILMSYCSLPAKSDTILASDQRFVSYEDLLPSLEQFYDDNGVGHFSELLFDIPRYQLIAGKP
jgi:hypothetical protein